MSPLPYAKQLRSQTLQVKKLSLFRRKQSVKHEFKSTTISRQLISASPARLKYVLKDREKKRVRLTMLFT